MKEDVLEFLLNIRDIRIKILSKSAEAGKMKLKIKGRKEVRAGDIEPAKPAGFRDRQSRSNPGHAGFPDANLDIEFNVRVDKGYQPASTGDNVGIIVTSEGTSKEMSIDAIYSPVTRANYTIESSGPGQGAGKEKLVLEIWTDSTIDPIEALSESIRHTYRAVQLLYRVGQDHRSQRGSRSMAEIHTG